MGYHYETPHLTQSPPKKKTGLTIGILILSLLLCLCLFALLLGGFLYRDQIPFISGLFASPTSTQTPTPTFTPTPQCIAYDDPVLGIHLCHPGGWVINYDPDEELLLLSPLADLSTTMDFPAGGVAVVIMRNQEFILSAAEEGYDVSSVQDIHYALTLYLELEDDQALEPFEHEDVAGYPGGRSLYLLEDAFPFNVVVGLVVSVSGDVPTFIITMADETVWEENRPIIEAMLDSVVIDPAMP
jgi:hypothetical protein